MDLGRKLPQEYCPKEGLPLAQPRARFTYPKKDHMLVFLLDKILDKAIKNSQNKFYNSVFNVESTVVVI